MPEYGNIYFFVLKPWLQPLLKSFHPEMTMNEWLLRFTFNSYTDYFKNTHYFSLMVETTQFSKTVLTSHSEPCLRQQHCSFEGARNKDHLVVCDHLLAIMTKKKSASTPWPTFLFEFVRLTYFDTLNSWKQDAVNSALCVQGTLRGFLEMITLGQMTGVMHDDQWHIQSIYGIYGHRDQRID